MKHLPIICLLLSAEVVCGQSLFNRVYPKPFWDYATAVTETDSNTYLIAASSNSQNHSSYDILLMNIDTQGEVIWEKYIGDNSAYEIANTIRKTSDGGYIIGGSIAPQSTYYAYALKLDQYGNKTWSQSLNSFGIPEFGCSVIENKDGEYIVVSTDFDHTNVYNLGINGNVNWVKHYQDVSLTSIVQTGDDGYALAGATNPLYGLRQIVLKKTNETGDILWSKLFGGPGDDIAVTLVETDDQGFLVAGSYDSEMPDMDRWIYLIRTDSQGDTLWTNLHAYDEGTSWHLAKTNDHCFVLSASAYAYCFWNDWYELKIEKINSFGETVWEASFPHRSINDVGNSVQQVSDGGYVLTGNTNNGDNSQTDVVLIKLDSLGNYVTGFNYHPIIHEDFITLFPLPAKETMSIQVSGRQHSFKTVEVYASSGRLVDNHDFGPHTCQADLNVSAYAPGLYLLKVLTGDAGVVIKKFIVSR